jgi:hypothetical protein
VRLRGRLSRSNRESIADHEGSGAAAVLLVFTRALILGYRPLKVLGRAGHMGNFG